MTTTHQVALIPGDSIGREMAAATQRLIAEAGVSIAWQQVEAGRSAFERCGDPMPDETIEAIKRHGVALKGRIMTPVGEGYESPNVRLRKELDLFAAVRPIQSQPGLASRYADVDIILVREATEDVYAGIEHTVVPGVVQSMKVTTREACERVIRFAFQLAADRGRKTVHVVHKANIMKKSDGLFLKVGKEIAAEFPGVEMKGIIADNACMQMVKNPAQFDVMVAQNLFGDLLSDVGAGLVGGISGVYGVLRGTSDVHVFEAIHGFAPHLEGKGLANPLPMIHPALALLRHLGETDAADRIGAAIGAALDAGIKTGDLGGTATCEGFVDALIARLG